MAEYIEREAAVHLLMTKRPYLTKDLVMDAAYEVSKIPAADVVPVVHGRWVKQDDYSCCSNCGQAVADECCPWFKHCPNCGAKMDAEE